MKEASNIRRSRTVTVSTLESFKMKKEEKSKKKSKLIENIWGRVYTLAVPNNTGKPQIDNKLENFNYYRDSKSKKKTFFIK